MKSQRIDVDTVIAVGRIMSHLPTAAELPGQGSKGSLTGAAYLPLVSRMPPSLTSTTFPEGPGKDSESQWHLGKSIPVGGMLQGKIRRKEIIKLFRDQRAASSLQSKGIAPIEKGN